MTNKETKTTTMADIIWWTHPIYFTTWTCSDYDTIDEYKDMCNNCGTFPPSPRLHRMNAAPFIITLDDLLEYISSYKYVEHVEVVSDPILDRKRIVVWVNMISVVDRPFNVVQVFETNPVSIPAKRTKIVRDMLTNWMSASLGMVYSARITGSVCRFKSVGYTVQAITLGLR